MKTNTSLLTFLYFMFCPFAFASAGEEVPSLDNKSLLANEVIAGCEANVSAIEYGMAIYSVSDERLNPAAGPIGKSEYRVETHFDGNQTRWDFTGKGPLSGLRCVSDSISEINFFSRDVNAADTPSFHLVAHIYDRGLGVSSSKTYHPRYLGHTMPSVFGSSSPITVVDMLRKLNGGNVQIKGYSWDIERDGGIIRVTTLDADVKYEFIISPADGYSLIGMYSWSLKLPSVAAEEMQCNYHQTPSGVFVANHFSLLRRIPVEGRYVDGTRSEARLERVSFEDRPKPELFALDALGLPKGARVTDKRTGKTYLYKVDAVTEEEINAKIEEMTEEHLGLTKGTLQGDRSDQFNLIIVINVIAVLMVIATIYFKRRRAGNNFTKTESA